MQGIPAEAHDVPCFHGLRADAFVDVDRWFIPGKDVPLQPCAAFADGDAGEFAEQCFADAMAAQGWRDVEVFKAYAVVAYPGAVAGEVKGETGRFGGGVRGGAPISDEGAEAWGWGGLQRRLAVSGKAPSVPEQIGFGSNDFVEGTLVFGKLADEAEDGGDVRGGGGANADRGGLAWGVCSEQGAGFLGENR